MIMATKASDCPEVGMFRTRLASFFRCILSENQNTALPSTQRYYTLILTGRPGTRALILYIYLPTHEGNLDSLMWKHTHTHTRVCVCVCVWILTMNRLSLYSLSLSLSLSRVCMCEREIEREREYKLSLFIFTMFLSILIKNRTTIFTWFMNNVTRL